MGLASKFTIALPIITKFCKQSLRFVLDGNGGPGPAYQPTELNVGSRPKDLLISHKSKPRGRFWPGLVSALDSVSESPGESTSLLSTSYLPITGQVLVRLSSDWS